MKTGTGLRCYLLTLSCLAFSAAAQDAAPSRTMRVCVDAAAYPPFSLPDRDGVAQTLVRMTAQALNLKLELVPMPINRCRALLQQGAMDALNGAAYVAENRKVAHFPLADEHEKPEKAIVTVNFGVYRLVGGRAEWDGTRFKDLHTPVLVNAGQAAVTQHLTELGQSFDAGGRNSADNLSKLLAGRAELMVQVDEVANDQLARAGAADKVERLPKPLFRQSYYFVFSKRYYLEHQDVAEKFWAELVEQKKSPAFQRAIKDPH